MPNQLHTENWGMLLLEPASHDTGQIELTSNLTRLSTSMLHKYLVLYLFMCMKNPVFHM